MVMNGELREQISPICAGTVIKYACMYIYIMTLSVCCQVIEWIIDMILIDLLIPGGDRTRSGICSVR